MRDTRWLRAGLMAAVLAVSSPPGWAAPDEDDPLERRLRLHQVDQQEQVRLVLLPTVVTDRRGRVVRGLEADDFRLVEDLVPQEIRYFATEGSQPIQAAFLLDLSGSMRYDGKLEEAKQAIATFVEALDPGDRFGLICFADEQVRWITEFTGDRARFLRRLEVQEAYGQTALFDAVAATPSLVEAGTDGRKAIVLITDGNDNASRLTTFSAVRLARQVNVPIYTIGFSSLDPRVLPKGSVEKGLRILKLFSKETGGSLHVVSGPEDLKEATRRIQEELRFQYLIGYRPTRRLWDGSYRKIELEASGNGRRVRTRSGYYATP